MAGVRESVGLSEISNFAKYRITGTDAETWLDSMLACKLPAQGRMTLAPMLKDDGRVIGDFSVARLADDMFLIIGSGLAESYHMRWFTSHLDAGKDVSLTAESLGLVGLSLSLIHISEPTRPY